MARSPTQSVTQTVRKLCCIESTTVARTQPEVVQPATTSVSARRKASQPARPVPKKAEAPCLRTTSSPGAGASSGTICDRGLASVSLRSDGALRVKTPASDPSSA